MKPTRTAFRYAKATLAYANENKFSDNEILENLDFNKLPKFLIENQKKYSKWLN